ncbi:AAA family ATPase [Streptomyces sp. NPDC048639]|uniref:helix-turn-helix transcriptional regulator n=1 Tax=Streptomyces sp. NPDC048639 TaxID=3365581 RepID=UPI003722A582
MSSRHPTERSGRGHPGHAAPGGLSPSGPDWPLVGREDELAHLDAVAAEVPATGTRVVQLDGRAGSGKSALLHTWLDRVQGFRVLRVRCRELERDFAFGTVRRLFRPLFDQPAGGESRSLLEDAEEAALELLDPGAGAAGHDRTGAGSEATQARYGLDTLVSRLSRSRPLLLAVDDLQWIDPPSLRWLVGLVHRADDRPILIAVTTRGGDRAATGPLYNELIHPSVCHTLVLEPLGPRSVERLVAAVFGVPDPDPSFCAACHAATDGHPLFLRALLCDAQRGGVRPTREERERIRTFGLPTLAREIRHRLGQGSDDTAQLARGLAILGDRKTAALLAAYCGTGEAVIGSAAARLQASGLLRDGEEMRFVHPVVRDVVLSEWTPQQVGEAHARAARVLHLSGGPEEEVAAHLLAAGPVPGRWALPVLRRAADDALRRGAAETAVTYLRHAVHQPDEGAETARVLLDLAAAAGYYDPALAVSYGTTALECLTDAAARSEAVGVLTFSHLLARAGRGRATALGRLARELRTLAESSSLKRESRLRMRALSWWLEFERPSVGSTAPPAAALPSADSDSGMDTDTDTDADADTDTDTDTAEGAAERQAVAAGGPGAHGGRAVVPAAGVRGRMAEPAGVTPAERQLLAIRAFDTLRAAEPAAHVAELTDRASVNLPTFSHGLFPLHYTVAQSLLYLDRLDDADALCDRLMRETAGQGMTLMASSLLVYRAGIALCRGDIDHAAAAARAAHERARSDGELPFRTALDAIMIDVHIERGDLTAADRVASAHAAGDPADVSWEWPRFLMSLASLRTAQGDSRAGLSLMMQSGRHWEAAGTVNPAFGPWRSRAARALLTMGAPADAHALIERELDLARRAGIPRGLGVALRAAGMASGGGRGLEQLAEAVGVLDDTPADLELARALYAYGGALLAREDRKGARTALRRGLDVAVRSGAALLAERLQKRLHDAGGRGSYRPAKDASPLTAGEERVVSMAVQGLSNREIAAHLYVSLRTVETHLTGAYRKLRIPGRSELARAMGDMAARRRA